MAAFMFLIENNEKISLRSFSLMIICSKLVCCSFFALLFSILRAFSCFLASAFIESGENYFYSVHAYGNIVWCFLLFLFLFLLFNFEPIFFICRHAINKYRTCMPPFLASHFPPWFSSRLHVAVRKIASLKMWPAATCFPVSSRPCVGVFEAMGLGNLN